MHGILYQKKGKATIFSVAVITDKLEADGALISPPSLHQCSVLRVFKAGPSYSERREVETRM